MSTRADAVFQGTPDARSSRRARRAEAFVRWALRRGGVVWLCVAVLAVPAFARVATLYARVRSDLELLLPSSAPSVVAIQELRQRMPGLQFLGVVVDAGSAAQLPAAERLIDDLSARVRAYPKRLVGAVRTSDDAERRFLQAHAALYADPAEVRAARERLEARRDYEVAKESGALLDEDAPAPSLDLDDLRRSLQSLGRSNRFDHARFSSERLHLTLLLVKLGDFDTGRSRGEQLLARIRHDLADLGGPERYAPGMRVGFAGDVAISVEETSALVADLALSSVVVVLLVAAAILFYYRWWPSVPVLVAPLFLATAFAFGIASLPPWRITALSSNTAFLGSIIVGNGINFGIVLLARYVEERRRGAALEGALAASVGGTWRATWSAALAAAVSYASLAITDFQGFRQFGVIGGLGMLLSWAAAFVLMPPLIAWLERSGVRPPRARREAARSSPTTLLARLVERHPRAVLAGVTVVTVAALGRVSRFDASQIESDFSRLRRADTWQIGEGYWGRRMEALLGTYLTPAVILTDDVAQARDVERALKTDPSLEATRARIASVRTSDDVLPPDQPARLRELRAIKDDLTPRLRARLGPEERDLFDRLLSDEALTPITAVDVPDTLLAGLRERDGTIGREVLVFPRPSRDLWQGGPLAAFVGGLRHAASEEAEPGSRAGRVAGSLPLSVDILASIRRDGPRACLAALLGVIAVVFVVLRARRESAVVIGSLLAAVTWLLAAMMTARVRINFVDFIAYPITFGIGVDYAVNLVGRQLQRPAGGVGEALRTTGGAVVLCSLTTIIGYSSLLMASNLGLRSFGVVAVLGEVCCLAAALVGAGAILRLLETRRAGVRDLP